MPPTLKVRSPASTPMKMTLNAQLDSSSVGTKPPSKLVCALKKALGLGGRKEEEGDPSERERKKSQIKKLKEEMAQERYKYKQSQKNKGARRREEKRDLKRKIRFMYLALDIYENDWDGESRSDRLKREMKEGWREKDKKEKMELDSRLKLLEIEVRNLELTSREAEVQRLKELKGEDTISTEDARDRL
ncbi:hypothetical protein DSL72_008505 [Monilinia vaccinii-corymbosi]|uniref:Uncharacterized protein n=1 Tax=Monilinia vaccinii-corymbosi TaxID=61207 RepID=A0A8A3PKW5_9HELO|nr:hypothetical protein DSL72_008505 [Monilinia vaccinii-corymbosi]